MTRQLVPLYYEAVVGGVMIIVHSAAGRRIRELKSIPVNSQYIIGRYFVGNICVLGDRASTKCQVA